MNDFERQVEKVRGEIAGIKAQLEFLENAPLPVNEAKAVADRVVDRASNEYLSGKVGYFFHRTYDGDRFLSVLKGVYDGNVDVDLTQMLIGLFPDLVRKRLHGLIEEHAKTLELGPPWEKRAALLAELEEKLFSLEVDEEQLIVQAEVQGVEIYRRPDVNPAAVLGIFEDDTGLFAPASAAAIEHASGELPMPVGGR